MINGQPVPKMTFVLNVVANIIVTTFPGVLGIFSEAAVTAGEME